MGKVIASIILLLGIVQVKGHGRLVDPPSRSSMWRYGFDTPPNYTDHELSCGGWGTQWQQNGGKCGICGDAWNIPPPRPNEDGGRYGTKTISRTYKSGQTMTTEVQLTAHHMGYFCFKVAPVVNEQPTTQEDLDKYPLQLADGSGKCYTLPPGSGPGKFKIDLKLPAGLVCKRCVFQWDYVTGNRWGVCEDGKGRNGCGPQETFRGCADISIVP